MNGKLLFETYDEDTGISVYWMDDYISVWLHEDECETLMIRLDIAQAALMALAILDEADRHED